MVLAFQKILKDRVALTCLLITSSYVLVAILCKLGIVVANWAEAVGGSYAAPSSDLWLGADIFGRSVLIKTIVGTQLS